MMKIILTIVTKIKKNKKNNEIFKFKFKLFEKNI